MASKKSLIRQPSAFIPIVLSLIVLATFVFALTFFGPPVREVDEGTAAHLFQIWLVIEVFMVGFFAITWLPQKPKEALIILILQIVAVLVACFPVFYFKL